MDRRDLLRQAGLSSLASLAPAAPIRKVRVGMLGTGHSHFTGKLKVMLDSADYEVAGVAEGGDGARVWPLAGPGASLKRLTEAELLADPTIHLIVVECRVWEALPWGAKVIAAGKHLHLEKPPGNDYEAFRRLVEDARKRNLLVQTGYLWRWHQGVTAALDAARQGWLGEVLMVRGTMNSDRGPEERGVEARYRGGGLFELGGHVIDRMVELLGRPKAVKSWLRHDTSVADRLADNNLAVLEYDRSLGVVTQVAKMAGAGEHRSFEVIGTDGSVLVHPEANPPTMRVHMRAARGPYTAGWQQIALPPQPRFIGDFAELARAIKGGQPLRHSYDHELLLHETLLRASGELKG